MSNPTISVNKLGEYLVTNPTRRKRIIQDQKDPSEFIVTRYKDAKDSIIDFIINGYNDTFITNGISQISAKKSSSTFADNDKKTSLECLGVISSNSFPVLNGVTFIKLISHKKLEIEGVDISIAPDVIIKGIDKKGKHFVGAIKIHISKSNTLNEEAKKYVATLLHQHIETNVAQSNEYASHEHCFSIDIFTKKFETAPKSYKRRRLQIASACEEIALWWSKL